MLLRKGIMAERKFDLVVFDWDGTLMDSTALIVASIQAACAEVRVAVPSREAAAHVIGLSLADAMLTIAPGVDEETCQKLVNSYRVHYLARDHELVLFDGAIDALEDLRARGYQLAVATGKARRGLSRVLEQSGLGRLFEATRCADESFSKPHPAMLLELMDELSVAPERTIMIGDTTHDLQMARHAGTASLAMTYGAHPVAALESEQPLAMFGSMAQLREWFACHG
jgi:phosphoglycolate phosphatase